ncbi:hypothetical protein Nepgr_011849 [Nepenthes gracilis]|uniref:Pulmonary surfactant-associated protein B n=1 Tax=Nepenthes gracilis TaxID=150966 RepID=A0AAD3SET6_NEPGR|nr:hypothetical protein Nepgr_011849 [Nepenthes gracilis]
MATTISLSLSLLLPPLIPILIFIIINRARSRKKNDNSNASNHKKLPPGEMGIVWIGETMEFFRAQKNNRLFEEFIQPRIRRYGSNTFKTRLMGSPTVIINGADANRFFLSNEFKLVVSAWPSSSVQLMGRNSIMEKQGEQHRRLRGILSSCLGNAGLEALLPKISTTILGHLRNKWQGKERISLFRSAKILTFTIICECLLGIESNEESLDCFERVLEGVFAPAVNLPGTRFWRAKRWRSQVGKTLLQIVRKKRKEMEAKEEEEDKGVIHDKEQDQAMLLSKLVAALINGEITEEEVVDNIVLLIFAAHDTTSFAIAMTFKMLALHPDCYSLLLQEHMEITRSSGRASEDLTMEDLKKMKYTWQVVRETMRLFPPIFGSFRRAIADIEFEGFTIPKGWKVLWTTYGTHNDEKYFLNPYGFNPKRFEKDATMPPYVFVPFGEAIVLLTIDKGIMDARVGLFFLLVLGFNGASNARNFASSDHSSLEKGSKKVDVCTLCEKYVTLALEYLSENKTQAEVIELLQVACSETHAFEKQCITLVDYYATLFFSELSSIQADEFCEKANLCQSTRTSYLLVNDDICDVCHLAVSEILIKLKDPDSKLEIIEILLKGCDAVENYMKKCKALVFEYGPLILTNAEKFLEKSDICTSFHACTLPTSHVQAAPSEGEILMVTSP